MYSGSPAYAPRFVPLMIHAGSLESIGMDLRLLNNAAPGTNAFPVANMALFYPFGVAQAITVVKMWSMNGSPVAGNIDMGIYLPDGTLVVSKGTTAMVGTTTVQELDITDTVLVRGRYYFALASDTGGATQKFVSTTLTTAAFGTVMGMYQMATAFPLPNPATFATFAQTQVPFVGLSTRTLVT